MSSIKDNSIPQPEASEDVVVSNDVGIVAAFINFLTSFLSKPWQTSIPFISISNRFQLIAYLIFFVGMVLPIISIMGDELIINNAINGFLSFVIWSSTAIAFVTLGLGLSANIPKFATKAVLGAVGFFILSKLWELYSLYSDMQDTCGRYCGDAFDMIFNQLGLGDELVESLNVGLIFFLIGFILLFFVGFGKVKTNQSLLCKLREINSVETQSRILTNDDVADMISNLNAIGAKILHERKQKIGELRETVPAETDVKTRRLLTSGNTKKGLVGLGAVLVLWVVWPTGVEAPEIKTVERLFKESAEFQQLQKFAASFGGLSVTVKSVDECETYTFEDGDDGVQCNVKWVVRAIGKTESMSDSLTFFNDPNDGWQLID